MIITISFFFILVRLVLVRTTIPRGIGAVYSDASGKPGASQTRV